MVPAAGASVSAPAPPEDKAPLQLGEGAAQGRPQSSPHSGEAMLQVVRDVWADLVPTSSKEGFEPPPLLQRIRLQLQHQTPKLRRAVMATYQDCRQWVVAGGTLRILLALAALSVAGCAAAGITLFGVILAVATANAVLVAFVLSLAAACSFLAMLLAALSAVYVGVLISSATIIGFITVVAMASAFGVSVLVCGLYTAYQAASMVLQFVSGKGAPTSASNHSKAI